MNDNLFEADFALWLEQQASLLRSGDLGLLDRENLAEEVEAMRRSERRELFRQVEVLLAHLLKWQVQPGLRCASWRNTLDEQRLRIARLLRDSPSLRPRVAEAVVDGYPAAVRTAIRETGFDRQNFAVDCPYNADQVLDDGFLPW